MTFQIHPLPKAYFEDLFSLSDADLKTRNILKVTADSQPGFPCRVSLQDAKIGEELFLLSYQHLGGSTPFAATHAIYVRKDATQAHVDIDEVPAVLARRVLSVRGFNKQKMMVDADVVNGDDLAQSLNKLFENTEIEFVHIHNAKQGCFAAMATRN
ncbi:DUF1203 domain-containing protein [Aliiroseovarius sp. S1339]|uniref:DUF1203 domain-containing protein n=1 Tax=Aliiroseovarius sp. S1339 TaxID=2936990 RepID=UPI0020BF90C9|nr:DUF1203 domain-containing protein [Aliiroseovarius sp. S1339]MCK8464049.1 DUF1203 domain-containing protein [Aliiroseovarius sp. S1339]